jgi:hypothetical protein
MKELMYSLTTLQTELDNLNNVWSSVRTPKECILEYMEIQKNKNTMVNKKRKDMERKLQQLLDDYRSIEKDKEVLRKILEKQKEMNMITSELKSLDTYIQNGVSSVLDLLLKEKFIERDITENTLSLTMLGQMASQLREVNCLVFSQLVYEKSIHTLTTPQLISLFSCFTNITIPNDFKEHVPKTQDIPLKEMVEKVSEMYSCCEKREEMYGIKTGMEYSIHYDLLDYVSEWCNCEKEEECKWLLQKIQNEKGIFLGEFVKALLKINTISCELEKLAEFTGSIELLSRLREIPNKILKYVVTNQSLYV